MEAFYFNEAKEHRMKLRGWFAFLLQERFKVQTGKIPYSLYWQGTPPPEVVHLPRPQIKNTQPKITKRQDIQTNPDAAFAAFGFEEDDE